jgi:hypothetical protein
VPERSSGTARPALCRLGQARSGHRMAAATGPGQPTPEGGDEVIDPGKDSPNPPIPCLMPPGGGIPNCSPAVFQARFSNPRFFSPQSASRRSYSFSVVSAPQRGRSPGFRQVCRPPSKKEESHVLASFPVSTFAPWFPPGLGETGTSWDVEAAVGRPSSNRAAGRRDPGGPPVSQRL